MAAKKISVINDELDIKLFLYIARKYIYTPLIFLVVAFVGAWLYLRYTHPVYETEAVIQIMSNEETSRILNFSQNEGNFQESELPKKVELMKSFTFLQRVASKLSLDVSYFTRGTILDFEQYGSSSYTVQAQVKNTAIYGTPIHLAFNDNNCKTWYTLDGGPKQEFDFDITERAHMADLDFSVTIGSSGEVNGKSNVLSDGYYFILNNPDEIVAGISQKTRVAVLNEAAKTISIKCQDRNPYKATDIVNKITEEFKNYDIEKQAESANKILAFIDERLGLVYDSLLQSEEKLDDFKRKFNIDSNLTRPLPTVYSRLSDYENQLVKLEMEESILSDIEVQLKIEKGEIDIYKLIAITSGSEFQGSISGMLTSLQQLLLKREELLYNVTENSGQIKSLDYQIGIQKKLLIESINTLKTSIKSRKAKVEVKVNDYQQKLEFKNNPYDAIELSSLQRIYSINEKFYNQLIEKKAEYSIAKAGYVSQNEVLRNSKVSTVPISPNKKKVYIVWLLAAFLLGFGIIIVRYILFNEIITVGDITKYTDTAILGIVPRFKENIPVSQLIVDKHPKSLIAEALRSIRTNLTFFNNTTGPKTIAVTSTVSGEGKTFFAINLAGVIAFSDKKVIVIDLDLRRPKIHIGFGAPNSKGMSTILAKRDTIENCIHHSIVPNLDFITAGPVPSNPSELIFGQDTEIIIEKLKEVYDFVIIDNPPVGLVTDGMKCLQIVDYPIYVFKADYSKRFYISNLNRLTEENKIKRLSIVLNAVEPPETNYGYKSNYKYSYGYGYIYGYGYYDEDMAEIQKRKSLRYRILKMLGLKKKKKKK